MKEKIVQLPNNTKEFQHEIVNFIISHMSPISPTQILKEILHSISFRENFDGKELQKKENQQLAMQIYHLNWLSKIKHRCYLEKWYVDAIPNFLETQIIAYENEIVYFWKNK